jgi:glutathione S-transferase
MEETPMERNAHTTRKSNKLTLCEVGETGIDHLESYSPFCVKVHRALRYAGLRYESRHGKHPGVFKSLNPAGQVPVLLVGDEPISDSTAIVERIDRLAGGPLSRGLDAQTLAEAKLWEELADTTLNSFLIASRWADDDNWPRLRDAFFKDAPKLVCALITPRLRKRVVGDLVGRDVWRAGPEACWSRMSATLDQLEARAPVGDAFWVADQITVADLAIFAQLQSLRCDVTPRQAAELATRKRLSAYLDRVDEATRQRRSIAPKKRRSSKPSVGVSVQRDLIALLSA